MLVQLVRRSCRLSRQTSTETCIRHAEMTPPMDFVSLGDFLRLGTLHDHQLCKVSNVWLTSDEGPSKRMQPFCFQLEASLLTVELFLRTVDNFSLFTCSWSFFAYSFSFLTYSWSLFAFSGKERLIRALRTVSKEA